jgi:hypothetical protein
MMLKCGLLELALKPGGVKGLGQPASLSGPLLSPFLRCGAPLGTEAHLI